MEGRDAQSGHMTAAAGTHTPCRCGPTSRQPLGPLLPPFPARFCRRPLQGCIAGGGRYVDHAIHNTSGAFFDRGMGPVGKVCLPTDAETTSHSNRPAALNFQSLALSFGWVMRLSLLPTISKGEHQTRRIDAHSSL